MLNNPDFITARELLLDAVKPVGTERICLSRCGGRVLARELAAEEDVPPFDRSPYDGYALRAADTAQASEGTPVTLRVLEEIPAGAVPALPVTGGTAAKVLTGAPIPPGADAVIMFEKTSFTAETVTVFSPLNSGENIIRAGEDVRRGAVLARAGEVIDPGLAGMLAAQGVSEPPVYRVPRVAVLSTGSELVEAEQCPGRGRIRNTNRYMLEAALRGIGCEPVYLGAARDSVGGICALLKKGFAQCDAVVATGGVSAGDYDLTPAALEASGADILFRGVDMKPGMACAYGLHGGKPVCALSGNPAAALTNFYAVAVPALRRLAGRRRVRPGEIAVTLTEGFPKKSPKTRLLFGTLDLSDGTARMKPSERQGNVVLSGAVGRDVMAVVPAGSGPVPDGAVLKGFLL